MRRCPLSMCCCDAEGAPHRGKPSALDSDLTPNWGCILRFKGGYLQSCKSNSGIGSSTLVGDGAGVVLGRKGREKEGDAEAHRERGMMVVREVGNAICLDPTAQSSRCRRRRPTTVIERQERRVVVVAQHRLLLLLLVLPSILLAEEEAAAASSDDSIYYGGVTQNDALAPGTDGMTVALALGIVPLVGIAAVLLVANWLIIPDLCTRALMKSYKTEGAVVDGTVLSCRPAAPSSTKSGWPAWFRAGGGRRSVHPALELPLDDDVPHRLSTPRYMAEIMYEAVEHRYMDNPSLKFRHPEAYETKRFVRTFEFDDHPVDPGGHRDEQQLQPPPLQRGDHIPVLLLRGINNTRSGCPQPVVERIYDSFSFVKVAIVLAVSAIVLGVLLTITLRNSWRQLEDPRGGWAVLLSVVVGGDCLGLLIAYDRFLKLKRRRFDSALPMVSAVEQREMLVAKRAGEQEGAKSGRKDPFRIPLHEFAGHARASERQRFD